MCKSNIHHCDHCGKEYVRKPSKKRDGSPTDRAFCSRPCYDEQRRMEWTAKAPECKSCGNRIERPSLRKGTVFCSKQCRDDLAAKNSHTKCIVCKTEFCAVKFSKKSGGGYYIQRDKFRKVCSKACTIEFFKTDEARKKKISESERGSKHHNWQGGGKSRGYRGSDWLAIAEKVREAAGYKCERCGKPQEDCGRKLDVNHKEPFHQHKNKKQANKMSNLEALCKSCHMKTEWEWRKSNPIQHAIRF